MLSLDGCCSPLIPRQQGQMVAGGQQLPAQVPTAAGMTCLQPHPHSLMWTHPRSLWLLWNCHVPCLHGRAHPDHRPAESLQRSEGPQQRPSPEQAPQPQSQMEAMCWRILWLHPDPCAGCVLRPLSLRRPGSPAQLSLTRLASRPQKVSAEASALPCLTVTGILTASLQVPLYCQLVW